MYKFLARTMIRRNIERLNRGDRAGVLGMLADDVEFRFPGQSSWAGQFRPTELNREFRATHLGRDEFATFLQRYVDAGIQMTVEDIVVNGPPWNARAAAKVHVWSPAPGGGDRYRNRAVLWVDTRWGKVRRQEDFEDTESAGSFDQLLATAAMPTL